MYVNVVAFLRRHKVNIVDTEARIVCMHAAQGLHAEGFIISLIGQVVGMHAA